MDGEVVAESGSPGNVILDLDGVVYVGGEAIPGAGDTLSTLERRGYTIVFATNNSTRTPAEVAEHIEATVGVPVHPEQIVTSGVAAATLADEGDGPAFVLGESGLAETLRSGGLEITDDPNRVGCVFVGLDWGLSYERLRDATTAVLAGARFIATNLDVTFPTPAGLWPGAGAIAAAVAAATGRDPEVAGKPHEAMRRAVSAKLGTGPTWMVGDRPETDIAFGAAAGWSTVLVLTGVVRDAAEIPGDRRPDHVLEAVTGLIELLP